MRMLWHCVPVSELVEHQASARADGIASAPPPKVVLKLAAAIRTDETATGLFAQLYTVHADGQ